MANDTLTYVLQLRDEISSKLKTISIATDTMLEKWADVEKKMNAAARTMSETGRSIGSLRQKIDALKMQREWIPASNTAAIRATNHEIQRLEKEVQKLESLDGGKFKKWLGDITGSIPALVNPLTAIGAGMVQSVRKGMESELQKQNLTTLLAGDTEAADALFSQIAEYGKNTVYNKEGLIEAQKTMMSFGISGEQAFATLKQIGDIAMGSGQNMQSLALAFSQASSLGKLMGNDYKQMVNAGFNPLQVISEKTGESMESLQDKMSQGKIGVDQLAQAFQWATEEGGLFYKGAEKAGQTLAGRMNKMKDTFAEMLVALYGAIEPLLSPIVDFATKALGTLGEKMQQLIDWFKEGGGWATTLETALIGLAGGLLAVKAQTLAVAAAAKIKAVADAIASASTLGWKAAMDALNLSFLASPITWIVAGIVAAAAAILLVAKRTDGWKTTWHNTMEYIKLSLEQCGLWMAKKVLQIEDSFLTGFENIKRGWLMLQSLWDADAAAEGLAKMQANAEARAQKIAEAQGKIDELAARRKNMDVWQVEWKSKDENEKGLLDGLKDKLKNAVIPTADNTAILSQAQFDLLKQHYDDLTKKQRAMIDKGYADLTDDEQRALKKRYDTLSKSEKRELDKQYNEAIKTAEAAQRSKENALKELYQKDGDKDAYEIGMGQVAIEGLEEQLKIAQKYGKDTTKIEQEIADAKIQQRENEYERQNNALAQSLEQRKLNLTKKLAEGTITQKQYDTQLQAAEQESYQKQLELQEQYGKNTIALQQQIAEAKIQRRNSDYDNEVDALQKNLDDTEISLKASLANQAITQDQYDRQMLAAKARFYDGMLNLTRAYGKDDRQAMRDVLDAQLNLQGFEKDQKKKPMETFAKGWDGIKGIGNSIRSIKDALTDTDNAWDALTQTVDGFISLFQSLQAIVEIIKTITAVTQTMQAVNDATTQKQLANAGMQVAANTAVAGSGAASSVASIPYVGPILAIAALASIVAAIATLPKFANGGLVYGPTLGLMGEYGGASSNPEVIAPLSRLRALLGTDGPGQPSEVKFRIEGRELVGIINKQTNINRRSY